MGPAARGSDDFHLSAARGLGDRKLSCPFN